MVWLAVFLVIGVCIAAWRWLIDDGDGQVEPGELFFLSLLRDIVGWFFKLPIWPLVALASLIGWVILDGVAQLPATPLSVFQALWTGWVWTLHTLHDIFEWLTD